MESHVRGPEPRGNVNTEHLPIAPGPRVIPDLRVAYAFARGVVKNSPDSLGGQPGHRLVFVRKAAFGGIPLIAHPDAFAIVGRHTQCGLVLADDPFVALRHVLVRSVELRRGADAPVKVALRLLDLHTDAGFTLADGSRQSSVFAEGPVAIGVGDYAVIALPNEAGGGDGLPDDLPAPQVEELPPRAVGNPYREPAVRPQPRGVSRITLMPNSVMLGSSVPAPNLGRLTTASRWAVTLERNGHNATVTVSGDDLVGGVVLGRSDKCVSEDLRRITDNNTSRVHVLILREGSSVHAFDLASTQGTFANGVATRHLELDDRGTVLLLGKKESAVRLFWRRIE